jgi:RHS repeat-associated protein
VYAWWTANPNRATNATYTVAYSGGTAAVTVNQQTSGGAWNLLGTYTFGSGTGGNITLTDQANGYVIADAIRLVPAQGQAQPAIYYIAPDHLNAPRMIANQQGTTVWKWDQAEPFGATAPNADPDGDGVGFDFPLRFPGQYFDRETGLHYNYYRDYDPSVGRYVESDPIGLAAGFNTYAYVGLDPLVAFDPFGLYECVYCVTQHRLSCTPDNPQNPSYSSRAYSSGNNIVPGCRNNPACENIRGVGPVPQGDYELRRPRSGRPNRLDLRPDPLPRDFIQVHSCVNPRSDTCSTGCIVSTPPNVRRLLNTLQLEHNNRIRVMPSCE